MPILYIPWKLPDLTDTDCIYVQEVIASLWLT